MVNITMTIACMVIGLWVYDQFQVFSYLAFIIVYLAGALNVLLILLFEATRENGR